MYKPTIWQDHVAGVQEGTDMNAANFNKIEAGIMEAAALAALNSAISRYSYEMAKNAEVVSFEWALDKHSSGGPIFVDLPTKRNMKEYNVVTEIKSMQYTSPSMAGTILISDKQANGFKASFISEANSINVIFHVFGGMY